MSTRSNAVGLGFAAMSGMALALAAPANAGDHRGAPAAGSVSYHDMSGGSYGYQTQGSTRSVRETTETVIGEDGVETVITTRYITRHGQTPTGHTGAVHGGYYPAAPHGAVFSREEWIAECRRRTDGLDGDGKGDVIGGLLGAVAGGIIGNRVADGNRLAGTLIGAGTGGLAGLAIGSLIDGDRDDDYDCEDALDRYIEHYGDPSARSRVIPAHGYPHSYGYSYGYGYGAAHHGGHYGYAGGYYPGCGCQAHITYIPVHYQQRQRVIVREEVTEQVIPGKVIKLPPKVIKQTKVIKHPTKIVRQPTKVVPAPSYRPAPVKMVKD